MVTSQRSARIDRLSGHLAAICVLARAACDRQPAAPRPGGTGFLRGTSPQNARVKIATWNVNDINKRLPILLAWLDATAPDVVALQELKTTEANFPFAALDAAGYTCAMVGQATWNGVALLARSGSDADIVVTRRSLPGDAADQQARYLEAAIDGVLFGALYAPNGNPCPGPKFDYKLAWLQRLQAHAAALWHSGHPVVLLGDYNVVPTDEDIYSPASWRDNALLQPQARAAWRLLRQQGWTDALLQACGPRAYTFWDYRRSRWERDAGLRIDHLLLSASLQPRLATAGVDRAVRGLEGSSDHAPAWLTLK